MKKQLLYRHFHWGPFMWYHTWTHHRCQQYHMAHFQFFFFFFFLIPAGATMMSSQHWNTCSFTYGPPRIYFYVIAPQGKLPTSTTMDILCLMIKGQEIYGRWRTTTSWWVISSKPYFFSKINFPLFHPFTKLCLLNVPCIK